MYKDSRKTTDQNSETSQALIRDVVLFDLDGTVLDTHDAILDSMRFATQKVLNKTIPDEVLVAEVGQPLVTQMRTLAPDEETAQKLLVVYRARNEEDLDQKQSPFRVLRRSFEALRKKDMSQRLLLQNASRLQRLALNRLGCTNCLQE